MKLSTAIIAGIALAGAASAASATTIVASVWDQYGYAVGAGDNGTFYVTADHALSDVTIGGHDFGALAFGARTGFFSLGDCEGSCTNGDRLVTIASGSHTASGLFHDSVGDSDDRSGRSILVGTLSVSATPEPAAWALMLVGFAGLGGALRASRKSAITA